MAAAPTSPPLTKIVPDADAVRLAEWRDHLAASPSSPPPAPRATVTRGGLVLVAEWGWAEPGEANSGERYAQLKAQLEAVAGEDLYVYPPHATHVTIATLSNFKKADAPRGFSVDDATDAKVVEAWAAAIERSLADAAPAVEPFTLEARRIELSPGAAFLHFCDPSGTVERLRQLVAQARDEDQGLAAVVQDYNAGKVDGDQAVRGAVHLPDIVHSSFARFVRAPPPGSEQSEAAAVAAVAGKFNTIAASFEPFPVRITRLTLANECAPYMHQGREEGTVRTFVLK